MFHFAGLMTRFGSLGEFEQAVLLAIAHLDTEAYGVTIRREIETRTRRTTAVGALYTALERLEAKGYVSSTMSDPTPTRGGRSKRHFRLTTSGRGALKQSREFLSSMWAGLDPELGRP
jgi:PadR family transcriptional regulator, regulatory protein PadR